MWKNLKIVELASVLAGPLVGTFFAELGASVVKIENKKTNGDVTRSWKLHSESLENNISAYYASANFGKESLMLDLRTEEDYQHCMALIQEADIVIQNFKPGDAVKLKLDAALLRRLNPSLIVASISGFGEDSQRPAFDVVLQAETGFMFMNGNPESGPIKMPVALIDILAAHHLKEAILIALIEKYKHGEGKTIHVSLYDAALASLANQASNYLMEGHIPQAIGTAHPNIAPYGDMYKTKDDKYLVLAIGNDKQFSRLTEVLQLSDAFYDRYSTNKKRLASRNEMNMEIAKSIAKIKVKDVSKCFLEQKIPFGQVKNLQEVFESPDAKKMISTEIDKAYLKKRIKTLLQ